ncbi:hypothetical protein Angca_006614, partial [Angiostrongylus cantonensis]
LDGDELKALVEANTRTSVQKLAEQLGVRTRPICTHLNRKGKILKKELEKWFPYELNDSRKNRRFEMSSAPILRNKIDPFLHRIVTCVEKWMLYDTRRRS